ncbi:MAG: low-complexity protein [Xanthomonadales bacterium]|nr:low-complexity protein [Xanthomonadales bacterium]
MAEKAYITKPVAAAVGVAFVSSLAVTSTAVASDNPFAAAELDSGYMLAGGHKGKEGKCGGEKHEEGKCGEGKCGGDKG